MAANYIDVLPGVPAIESPFFSELFDAGDDCFRIAKDLHERGFAILDFPDPEFDDVAQRLKRDLHEQFSWADWHAGGPGMRVQDAWQFNDDVRRIAANREIIALLSRLYGRRAFPFQTLNFPVGTQQHYHTDSVHFSARPERFMCGVWVALEDVGPEQGPLLYYPGSHRWPIYTREHIGKTSLDPHYADQREFEPLWRRLVEVHGIAPERFFPRKGQALIWTANLLHGGDLHFDRQATRWSQVTHYFFENCVYYTPLNSNEPAGEIFHRRPIDIATGEPVDCFYNGQQVPDEYVDATRPRIHQSPDFDAERYLQLNPDVAAAGIDPWHHFLVAGRFENRPT